MDQNVPQEQAAGGCRFKLADKILLLEETRLVGRNDRLLQGQAASRILQEQRTQHSMLQKQRSWYTTEHSIK